MANRKKPEPAANGYLHWSLDPAASLFAVLPLWILYEVMRFTLAPQDRNGAEALVHDALHLLGPSAPTVLRILFAGTVVMAAISIHRRRVPWVRVALVSALEGAVYGLMLGPLSAVLATRVALTLEASKSLWPDLVGSLGAGIFEEAVFRLLFLSLLSLLFTRVCDSFALPRLLGVLLAILVSGALFSLFHHLGPGGQVFSSSVFVFRCMAGILLGALFVLRGFAVCVYTHAMYDVHYYLTH